MPTVTLLFWKFGFILLYTNGYPMIVRDLAYDHFCAYYGEFEGKINTIPKVGRNQP